MSKKNREQRSQPVAFSQSVKFQPDTVTSLAGTPFEHASIVVAPTIIEHPEAAPSEPEASPEPEPTASAPEAVQEPVSVACIVELVDRINVHKRVYRVFPGPRGLDVQFPRASDRLLSEVRQAIAREMPGAAMVNGRPCALTRLSGDREKRFPDTPRDRPDADETL